MSAQLFANMQARFRDEVRLTSETSGLETEREIAERRAAQREQLAVTEQEFKRKESERKAELDAMNTRAAAELAALAQSQEKEQRLRELAHEAELADSAAGEQGEGTPARREAQRSRARGAGEAVCPRNRPEQAHGGSGGGRG